MEDVCKKFDLRYEIQHQSEPALCDPTIMEHITDSCGELMMRYIEMLLGASHDVRTLLSVPWV